MLLLVLILVLVAFALLVVALLSGSVLSAWLSVAVSVAAAIVLIVDWLHRRSAVKAGSGPAPGPSRALADVDPVTEVLPVVPAGGAVSRSDEPDDSLRTIAMPVVKPSSDGSGQPSGSASGPSGAAEGITSSGGVSSQSVTKEPVDHGAEASSAERTVVVDTTKKGSTDTTSAETEVKGGGGPAKAGSPAAEPVTAGTSADDHSSSSTVAGLAAAAGTAAVVGEAGKGERPDEKDGSVRSGVSAAPDPVSSEPSSTPGVVENVVGGGVDTSSTAALPPVNRNGTSAGPDLSKVSDFSKGTDLSQVTGAGPGTDAAGAPVAEAPAASATAADTSTSAPGSTGGATSGVIGSHGEPIDAATGSAPDAGDVATRIPAESTITEPPVADANGSRAEPVHAVGLFEPTTAGTPPGDLEPSPPAALGEAPQEHFDAAAARIVAGVTDEVLVVDEQPRYHVSSCRSLVGMASIPLPAREAVELGFTPCGWCSPDATLAARHRADSQP